MASTQLDWLAYLMRQVCGIKAVSKCMAVLLNSSTATRRDVFSWVLSGPVAWLKFLPNTISRTVTFALSFAIEFSRIFDYPAKQTAYMTRLKRKDLREATGERPRSLALQKWQIYRRGRIITLFTEGKTTLQLALTNWWPSYPMMSLVAII